MSLHAAVSGVYVLAYIQQARVQGTKSTEDGEMLPLLARFLNDLSQARGEVYLEEHERSPLLLPINKLQEDSWVCFLESQSFSLSQHTVHCASLLGWPATSRASAGNFGC